MSTQQPGRRATIRKDSDQKAFDSDYDSMSLRESEGTVQRVLSLENIRNPELSEAVNHYTEPT